MSKIDILRLDDAKASDEGGFILITSKMIGQEEQEMGFDPGEVERLRDWLTGWLDGKVRGRRGHCDTPTR